MEDTPPIPDSNQAIINVNVQSASPEIKIEPSEVKILPSDNAEAKTANLYTLIGIGVNALLFCITLAALIVTCRSVDISQQALNDSRNQQKHADSIRQNDALSARIKDSIQYSIDTASLKLSLQSVQAQLRSLKENEKEFELSNRPVVHITGAELKNLEVGQKIALNYEISNYGRFPALIEIVQYGIFVDAIKTLKQIETQFKYSGSTNMNRSISSATTIPQVLFNRIINQDLNDKFKKGEQFIYAMMEVNYKDLSTKKKYRYSVIMRIGWVGGGFDYQSLKYNDIIVK